MYSMVKGLKKLLRTSSLSQSVNSNVEIVNRSVLIEQNRKDKNCEDITIVWLSKNVNHEFIGSLRTINDYIQVFTDEQQALAYIEQIYDEKVLLIVEELSDDLCEVLKSFKQIDTIFIYTKTSEIKFDLLNFVYCFNEEQLIERLTLTCECLRKQTFIFSVYTREQNNDKRDFTGEIGSFLFFNLFKNALKFLPKNSESKKLTIAKYRNYYLGNEKVLQEINDFNFNYKSNDALKWFQNNTFISRLINKALRTEDFNTLCSFHFYIGDLSKQIESQKHLKSKILQVYRCFHMSNDELDKIRNNIGKLILTNSYLSATRQQNLEFNVRIQYTIDLNSIQSISFAENQQTDEILFDLGTMFKIISCEYNENEQMWLVNVNATDEGNHIAAEYIEYQKSKMTESNIILMLGHLIIETGNYPKAEKYFQAFLNSPIPTDEEIACIYYNLGRIYRLKQEYEQALEYLNQAYLKHCQARPTRLLSGAKAMNAIGIVSMELDHKNEAIEAFQCALKLYSKAVEQSHPDVAGTLINLGNIYSQQEKFAEALFCFERAQKIYDKHLPVNHPNVAILLNNIANLCFQQQRFQLALDTYEQALQINQRFLPNNHPTLLKNRENISKVCLSMANQPPQYTSIAFDSIVNTEIIEMNNYY